ncbi:hypothetical protein IE53DRAFT_89998 [Violaceomyces palustris]|uniref:Uncharacterized protein n=1 Tax=Violaceomyces palustris TaxID=1673888 RepID=A0ACD0P7D3_9BASI|nr:hypothetical protein IE53DRAFT_89998 [Violaceomyces palustris]
MADSVSVLLTSFSPLNSTLSLRLPLHTTAYDILRGLAYGLTSSSSSRNADQRQLEMVGRMMLLHNGKVLDPSTRLGWLASPSSSTYLSLQVLVRLPGGKGGFGSMLRAQGGKMSSGGKNANTDSCRDLNGRRLSTMKEAKKLAAYLEAEPARRAALSEAQAKKYAKLERMLGRAPKDAKDFEEAALKLDEAGDRLGSGSPEAEGSRGSGSGGDRGAGPSTTAQIGNNHIGKRKERLEDNEYLEQSREIVENVRSAVATAMMKKKKKKATNKAIPSPKNPINPTRNEAEKVTASN